MRARKTNSYTVYFKYEESLHFGQVIDYVLIGLRLLASITPLELQLTSHIVQDSGLNAALVQRLIILYKK